MKTLTEQTVRIYETHITTDEDGTRIALWSGDAGYESMDPNAPGSRHRLLIQQALHSNTRIWIIDRYPFALYISSVN